jgi:hypothetical protein
MLEEGYIETSKSSWFNPLTPVQNPSGEVRITSNMQFLNNFCESNNYTVTYINEVIEKKRKQIFYFNRFKGRLFSDQNQTIR